MKKLVDTYSVYARFFPCIIVSLPLFVLWYFVSGLGELEDLMSYVASVRFVGSVSFGAVFLYFYSQMIRTTAKYFERKHFLDSRGFPTTYLMMYDNDIFSRSYKSAYRKEVRSCLGIGVPDEQQEERDPAEARKLLAEAAKLIILRVGDGKLVKKHNIWYGFVRNLIGGLPYALISCLVNIAVGLAVLRSGTLWAVSAVLLAPYGIVLLCHKRILFQHAEAYAKQLIAEFLAAPNGSKADASG